MDRDAGRIPGGARGSKPAALSLGGVTILNSTALTPPGPIGHARGDPRPDEASQARRHDHTALRPGDRGRAGREAREVIRAIVLEDILYLLHGLWVYRSG